MTTVFVLLLVAAVVVFVLTKKSQQPIKLVGNIKKVEKLPKSHNNQLSLLVISRRLKQQLLTPLM